MLKIFYLIVSHHRINKKSASVPTYIRRYVATGILMSWATSENRSGALRTIGQQTHVATSLPAILCEGALKIVLN